MNQIMTLCYATLAQLQHGTYRERVREEKGSYCERGVIALPVEHLLPALHVKAEVGEGDGGRVRVAGQQVPRPLVLHLIPLLPLLPAPLALLVPAERREGRTSIPGEACCLVV